MMDFTIDFDTADHGLVFQELEVSVFLVVLSIDRNPL